MTLRKSYTFIRSSKEPRTTCGSCLLPLVSTILPWSLCFIGSYVPGFGGVARDELRACCILIKHRLYHLARHLPWVGRWISRVWTVLCPALLLGDEWDICPAQLLKSSELVSDTVCSGFSGPGTISEASPGPDVDPSALCSPSFPFGCCVCLDPFYNSAVCSQSCSSIQLLHSSLPGVPSEKPASEGTS